MFHMTEQQQSNPIRKRYPPPWRIEATEGGYKVVSANGVNVAWTYCLEGFARNSSPNMPTRTEAHAIAKAIVLLAETLPTAP